MTRFNEEILTVPMTGQNNNRGVMSFPGYPVLFDSEGRTKDILAHYHGIEDGRFSGGKLAISAGVVEPGTLMIYKLISTLIRGQQTWEWQLYPFIAAFIDDAMITEIGEEGTEAYSITFFSELFLSRFKVGQHLWQLPADGLPVVTVTEVTEGEVTTYEADVDTWQSQAVDLGLITAIDEESFSITVENEPTITGNSIIYVASDELGTFPEIVGCSYYFARYTMTDRNGTPVYQEGKCIFLEHACVNVNQITYYADTGEIYRGQTLRRKVRADVPLLRFTV